MSAFAHAELYFVDLTPPVVRTDAIQSFVSQETPILRLTDADGATGTGYTYTIGAGGSSIVALLNDHLLPRLQGRDLDDIEAIGHHLTRAVNALTVGPVVALAMAAIDTAMWDLRCRRTGMPLHKAVGGARNAVPVYTTEGGWRHLEPQALVADALASKAAGFQGAKVKLGKPSIRADVDRLAAVREAVGPAWHLMVDANQAFRVDEVIRRAAAYEQVGLTWFEEPLPADPPRGVTA